MFRVSRRLAAVAAVVCVVVGVVSVASAAPQPGKSCKVAGRERVTSAGTLRCVASSGRSLRWVQVAAPVTTTTTTTTTSSTTTTVTASARAPQVSAISADDSRVRFTLSGMSPDTGNYAVQWVNKGQSFNTYRMLRVTDKNVSISTAEFACGGSTYTFRVFVMRADWQLSDGHQRQNVTPHTEPFDVVFTHACPTSTTAAPVTTTTIAATSCADGGTCAVGDTGPGGGTVFYVHPSGTFSCGRALQSICKYLEFAPTSGASAWTDVAPAWSGNITSAVGSEAQRTDIGTGYSNTMAIVNDNGTADRAATASRAFRGPNSQTDWYLPSRLELNELCKYARQQTTGDTSVNCAGTGALRSGFQTGAHWSSTESTVDVTRARTQGFTSGSQSEVTKSTLLWVRPIRAFGGTTGCADGGTCAVGDTGPGGGTVFYVHPSGTFTSTGSDCGTSCKYLETARSDQSTGVVWCSNDSSPLGVTATAIGSGMANTTTADTTCTSGAIQIAADYSNNGKTDWHLPSKDELNELCKYAKNTGQAAGGATLCSGGADAALRDFTADNYWSSSEDTAITAWQHSFFDGSRGANTKSPITNRVRVVRAFG